MKQFYKIDDEGYYIEPVILRPIIEVDEDLIVYFPEEFALHILGELEVPEITDEFIEEYNLPKANCKTPKERLIDTPLADGMYKPRWTGTEWIDEITEEELDAMREEADAQPRMMSFEAMSMKLEHTEKVVNELIKQFVLADNLTDEQKEFITSQYRKIGVGDIVYPDEIVNINGELFKYVQPNEVEIVTESWLTDASLFTPFLQAETDDGTPVVEEFKQPTGEHDAYHIGDKVLFNGDVYESIIDNNTWSPSAYPQGWKIVDET